jgi:CheY-like chemotaxis protein
LISWRESDGPPVQAPTRKGFGTTIINRSIPYDLGGEARLEYKLTGVEAWFRIPAKHVSEPKDYSGPAIHFARPPERMAAPAPVAAIKGENVLLVEDSLIIALDAEDILKRLGAAHVAIASTVEDALAEIERAAPTLAMLDINLGDQLSFAVADRLLEMKVPFLFATGYGEQAELPDQHKGRPVMQKPYTLENLARIAPEVLGQTALA